MKLDYYCHRRLLLLALLCSATLGARAQHVGVGTLTPSERLDVVGGNFKLSTSGSYIIFPDGTTQGTAANGTGFILNGTAAQANSNFNISGNGTIGGNGYVNGGLGVVLNQQDRPLITRGYDAFTSGNYSGAGRWGLFMESQVLTFGVPALASKNFQWATYGVNSTITSALMTLTQSGQLGIGVTGPATTLDVRTTDASAAITVGSVGAGAGALYFGNPNHGVKRNYSGGNDVGLYTTSGTVYLSANGTSTSQVALLNNGNLGIGTNTPTEALEVNGGILARGNGLISNQGAHLQWNRANGGGETFLLNQQGGGPGGIVFGASNAVSSGTNTTIEWGRFDNNGRLGIGTSSPIAPLHVSGSAGTTTRAGGYSFFNPGSGFGYSSVGNGVSKSVVAYFEGGEVWVNSYVVAGALQTTSDRRIKHVVGRSDRATDLVLLNRLHITDYTYIDQLNNTNQVVKKVIAQEVEEVLPAAVTRSIQALPNVYEKATKVSYANGQLTVTTAKPHDLPATGGRMRFYTPANASLNPEVTVVDAHTIRFASAEAYADGLFVYGKYVDDFRSVDYDAIAMLNVSATQELARKVAELEKQNAALKARTVTLEADATQTATDHADLQTLKAQLARLLGEQPTAEVSAHK